MVSWRMAIFGKDPKVRSFMMSYVRLSLRYNLSKVKRRYCSLRKKRKKVLYLEKELRLLARVPFVGTLVTTGDVPELMKFGKL